MTLSTEELKTRDARLNPRQRIECGEYCEVGIAIDDHCFVVLLHSEQGWMPTPWIPKEAAEWMASNMDLLN